MQNFYAQESHRCRLGQLLLLLDVCKIEASNTTHIIYLSTSDHKLSLTIIQIHFSGMTLLDIHENKENPMPARIVKKSMNWRLCLFHEIHVVSTNFTTLQSYTALKCGFHVSEIITNVKNTINFIN